MKQSLKKTLQNAMLLPQKNKYEKNLRTQLSVYEKEYASLVDTLSNEESQKEISTKITILKKDEINSLLNKSGNDSSYISIDDEKYYVLLDESRFVYRDESTRVIYEYVNDNPQSLLCYGDEDYFPFCTEVGIEKKAYYYRRAYRFSKPCFSPETLCSFNYIGTPIVRGDILRVSLKEYEKICCDIQLGDALSEKLYALTFILCAEAEKKGIESIKRIPRVLTSLPISTDKKTYESIISNPSNIGLLNEEFKKITPSMSEEAYGSTRLEGEKILSLSSSNKADEQVKVSVIIPSKDNPDMLRRCIDSLGIKEKDNVNVIVVDNGSNDENKKTIEEYITSLGSKNRYIYEVSEFNYSHMNNIAARESDADVLILLNDDIECDNGDWINVIANEAMKDKVGCVGCKLLYPDGTIQHTGIAGGVDGPAHVHMGEEDSKCGWGENLINRNVLAVTGACLAIKKILYDEMNGLFEELRVGYNDVDLCMRLFEAGYRNVILNDIKLIHHESVSRGKDAKSNVKRKRLQAERELLVKRHPMLMTEDPYEGGISDYRLQSEKVVSNQSIVNVKKDIRKSNDDEGWIYSSFNTLSVVKDNGTSKLITSGYMLVPGIDNMRFDFDLILQKDDEQFIVPIEKKLSMELTGKFNGTDNTQLSGFNLEASLDGLTSGEYEILFYAKDYGNVRELITDTGRTITV
ncbi:MAG: glycosyltransferase [Lachnospiraceae bacterium]|nr:glycosyltransferase [Lachnospiraceae bacterium]